MTVLPAKAAPAGVRLTARRRPSRSPAIFSRSVAVSAVEDQQAAADALVAFFRASSHPDKVVGNFGIDPLAAAALTGAPEDYRRYLVNSFREAFDMPGVPVRLEARGTTNPYADKDD